MVLGSRAYLMFGRGEPPGGDLFLLLGLWPAFVGALFSQLQPPPREQSLRRPDGPKQRATCPSTLFTCGHMHGRGMGSVRWEFKVQNVWTCGSQRTASWSGGLLPHAVLVERARALEGGAPRTCTQRLKLRVTVGEAGVIEVTSRSAPRKKRDLEWGHGSDRLPFCLRWL